MTADPVISGRDDALTEDPLLGFNFLLEVGDVQGFFTEVSGIGSENEIVEHKVVDNNGIEVVRKIAGRLKWTDISLKRGVTSDMAIWDWRQDVVEGDMTSARKAATITMLDRMHNPVAIWNFANAWPSKVTGPAQKSDDNSIAIEEMTLVHEGMSREQ